MHNGEVDNLLDITIQ